MGHHPKKSAFTKLTTKQKLNLRKKESKKFRTEKKARLIIRNLPFKTTEESLLNHYQQYGDVKEVQLLRRPDGKLVGCGFVQFKEVQKAAKARFHTNGKPFLGRNIQCDFALSKNKFVEKRDKKLENEVKEEPEDATDVKEEPVDATETKVGPLDVSIKSEPESNDETEESKSNLEKNDKFRKVDDSDAESKDNDNSDIVDVDDENNSKINSDDDIKDDDFDDDDNEDEKFTEYKEEPQRPRVISNDVSEGKTVFVKNIPFSATNEDLKKCMWQFGPVYYALICVDKLTEHSKGTGFVKFVNSEDAEKCLQAGTELTIFGTVLDCHKALDKKDLNSKDKKDEKRDSRNLYLVKEGVVLAGTKAAEGVSAKDMAKRLQIEQYKTQMLRNLNMFVSKTRLVVHNLPLTWDDSKLRQLLQRHIGPKAIIKEAKVMRNMKKVDSEGVGVSKEFGFVTFGTHEDALIALRSLNNNPNIFSEKRRPIVAFSIENKVKLNAREKRLQNSMKKNPKSKHFDPALIKKTDGGNKNVQKSIIREDVSIKREDLNGKQRKRKWKGKNDAVAKKKVKTENNDEFAGVVAKPGVSKMRSRYNLKTQAEIHRQHLKQKKNKLKSAKKTLKQKKEDFIRQPSQKKNKNKKENDDFSKIVDKYSGKLKQTASKSVKKQKWFESV